MLEMSEPVHWRASCSPCTMLISAAYGKSIAALSDRPLTMRGCMAVPRTANGSVLFRVASVPAGNRRPLCSEVGTPPGEESLSVRPGHAGRQRGSARPQLQR